MNKIIFLAFCVIAEVVWADFSSRQLGEPCTTSDHKNGTVKLYNICETFYDIEKHEKNIEHIRNGTLETGPEEIVVCCPMQLADKLQTKLLPKAPKCGTELKSRIFGGNVTTIYEFNWMVLLEYKKQNIGIFKRIGFIFTPTADNQPTYFDCAGNLINNRYVLTAAHCITSSLFSVHIGEHDLKSARDCDPDDEETCLPPVQNIEIEEKIVHPDYKQHRDYAHNDIALLRLKTEAKFNEFIKPVCLPSAKHLWDKDYAGDDLKVAGWGFTEDETKSSVKLFVEVQFVHLDECQIVYNATLIDQQICAGGEKGKDSCIKFAGGPLMLKDLKNPFGPYYLAGIVSYGAGNCSTEGMPGVYTKVADYLEWIVDTIQP